MAAATAAPYISYVVPSGISIGSFMKLFFRLAVAAVLLAAIGAAGWFFFSPSTARVEPTTLEVSRGDCRGDRPRLGLAAGACR